MDYCNNCGGTGQTVNGKFCTCPEGKLKKRMEDAEAKKREVEAKEERAKMDAKAKKEAANAIKSNDNAGRLKEFKGNIYDKIKKSAYDFTPGDWIIISNYNQHLNGVLCEVLETAKDEVRVLARGANKKGQEMKGATWIHTTYVTKAPERLKPQDKKAVKDLFINLAIDTNDIEWFKELKKY